MSSDYEKLFLIEILVDSVAISNDKLNLDPSIKSRLGEICVMFQFLHYPPLVVCEEDFAKQRSQQTTSANFSHGKSCLFSIRSSATPTVPARLDINVAVMQKFNSPDSNQEVNVGNVTIPMGESFTSMIKSTEQNPVNFPATKNKSGTYDLLDSSSNIIGSIAVFLRLSSFGQMIVTQIQLGGEDNESFMFKGTDYEKIYEMPGDETKAPVPMKDANKPSFTTAQQDYAGPTETAQGFPNEPQGSQPLGNSSGPQMYPGGPQGYPTAAQPYPGQQMYPGGPSGYPPYDAPSQEIMNGYYNAPPPSEKCPVSSCAYSEKQGNFKEIVAEIRGHALKIRVPRKPKKKYEEEEDKQYFNCQQLQDLQRELQGDVSRSGTPGQCQCTCMR